MFKNIVVALDGSDHARKAVNVAGDLAALYDAQVTLVHVRRPGAVSAEVKRLVEVEHLIHHGRDPQPSAVMPAEVLSFMHDAENKAELIQALGELGRRILDDASDILREKGVTRIETQLLDGAPANRILSLARSVGADLIALGSRGMGDLEGLLHGSVSHRVSQLAECTCLTVK